MIAHLSGVVRRAGPDFVVLDVGGVGYLVSVSLTTRQKIPAPGAEYEALRTELSERLTALTDPKTNERAVSRVFKREDVYRRFQSGTFVARSCCEGPVLQVPPVK